MVQLCKEAVVSFAEQSWIALRFGFDSWPTLIAAVELPRLSFSLHGTKVLSGPSPAAYVLCSPLPSRLQGTSCQAVYHLLNLFSSCLSQRVGLLRTILFTQRRHWHPLANSPSSRCGLISGAPNYIHLSPASHSVNPGDEPSRDRTFHAVSNLFFPSSFLSGCKNGQAARRDFPNRRSCISKPKRI